MRKTPLDLADINHDSGIGNPNPSAGERSSPVRRWSLWFRASLLVVCAVLGFAAQSQAQVRFGAVAGYVTDLTDKAVSGATVALTNTGTSEKSVIERFTVQTVPFQVDQTTRVDAALKLGSVSQSVEVTSSAITLQTDSSSLGSVVTDEAVQNIPVSGRNVDNLITLIPVYIVRRPSRLGVRTMGFKNLSIVFCVS